MFDIPASAPYNGTMSKILIVEDNESVRLVLSTRLERSGFEVAQAEDGFVGLDEAKRFRPDLVLLDLLMPEVDGFEFLKHFQDKDRYPRSKVIVFSNSGNKEDTDKALALGAHRFAVKAGTSIKDLHSMIEELLK